MKTLCVVSHSPSVAAKLGKDLTHVFGQFMRVVTWSMDTEAYPPDEHVDVYLASFPSVYDEAQIRLRQLPDSLRPGKFIQARRLLSPVHFNKLLVLPQGTRVIIAGNSRLACEVLQKSLNEFGVRHLDVRLHYPAHPVREEEGYRIAVVTGINKVIPPWVTTIIDIGVKELAFTTYSQIIREMGMPPELLDDISMNYTIPIFGVTKKYFEEGIKVNAILQCVEDAVFTIDVNGFIDICNSEAMRIPGHDVAEGRLHLSSIFPKLDIAFPLRPDFFLHDIITECDGQHYILKLEPVQGESLGAVVLAKQVSRVQELEGMVRKELKRSGNTARYTFQNIVTRSPEMKKVVELAGRFAGTKLTVLLEGESGVGKELFAHAIHNASDRAAGPFVAINLAAMPESLAESELFGYMEGSFTGARRGGRRGLFEEAHRGTIFLDEVGDAPLPLQTKLLRVLEEREIRKLGGKTGIPIDVRVVVATNKPLASMIQENTFRSDLFYRLCACPLSVPPLRERRQDIQLLAVHFAEGVLGEPLELSLDVQRFFETYAWPGNVRELQNVVNYLVSVVGKNRTTTMEHLPRYLLRALPAGSPERPSEGVATMPGEHGGFAPAPSQEATIPSPAGGNSAVAPSTRPPVPLSAPASIVTAQDGAELHAADPAVFHSCLRQYVVRGILKHATAILDILEEHSSCGLSTGRNTLLRKLRRSGSVMSMHALRICLKMLLRQGFINVGVTRQGSWITSQGTDFLHWLRQGGGVEEQSPESVPDRDGPFLHPGSHLPWLRPCGKRDDFPHWTTPS